MWGVGGVFGLQLPVFCQYFKVVMSETLVLLADFFIMVGSHRNYHLMLAKGIFGATNSDSVRQVPTTR